MSETHDEHGSEPMPQPNACFRNPALTVDAAVFRLAGVHSGCTVDEIVMIRRGHSPYEGCLAFPGGFVEYNENPEDAAVRELKEECGIDGTTCGLIAVRGSPGRDPRKHTVTVCYAIAVNDFSSLQAGDDAAAAFLVPLSSLETASMAFDHGPLAQQASEWLYKRGGRQMLVNVFEQHRNAASS